MGAAGYWRCWVNGRWRVIDGQPRQIKAGREAGRFEVKVKEPSVPKGGAWRIVPRRYVVDDVREVI